MTRRRITGAILLAAITATGLITWSLGSASGAAMNRVTVTCAKDGYDQGAFERQVDSIVAPGQPQSAHLHGFYGGTDISSTMSATPHFRAGFEDDPGDLAPAFSNCSTYGDWAEYWFPSPKFNGADISPGLLKNTYQAPAGTQVAAPPFGMTFVSGNAKATMQGEPHVRFTCGSLDEAGSPIPTDCTAVPGGVVTAEVTFPDCWDGTTGYDPATQTTHYDTLAGISPAHFSYSDAGGACAAGSRPMAQLVTQQTFIDPRTNAPMTNPLNADGTLGLSFSSGPYYTYHGDHLNRWNHILPLMIQQCLNEAQQPCVSVNNVDIR